MLDLHGDFDSATWHMILHARLDEPGDLTLELFSAWLDDVIAAINDASYLDHCSTRLHMTGLRGVVEFLPGVFHEADRGADLLGHADGSAVAAGSAAVVSWTGPWHYRGGKPKSFMPGIPASAFLDSKTLSAAFCTALAGSANVLINGVNETEWSPGHPSFLGTVSFQTLGAWRDPAIFRPYTGAIVHPRIGSQRRRDGAWIA